MFLLTLCIPSSIIRFFHYVNSSLCWPMDYAILSTGKSHLWYVCLAVSTHTHAIHLSQNKRVNPGLPGLIWCCTGHSYFSLAGGVICTVLDDVCVVWPWLQGRKGRLCGCSRGSKVIFTANNGEMCQCFCLYSQARQKRKQQPCHLHASHTQEIL